MRQSELESPFDSEELPYLRSIPLEGSCFESAMDPQLARPWIVWCAGLVLALSSTFFGTLLLGTFFIYGDAAPFQVQRILLLVALPLTGLVGFARRKLWGRDVALLSLVSLCAFILQGFWSIFGENPLLAIRTPVTFSVFILLIVLLTALPYIFAKLRWGTASREFFRV